VTPVTLHGLLVRLSLSMGVDPHPEQGPIRAGWVLEREAGSSEHPPPRTGRGL